MPAPRLHYRLLLAYTIAYSSPTLSSTDPVPRGLLTLCPLWPVVSVYVCMYVYMYVIYIYIYIYIYYSTSYVSSLSRSTRHLQLCTYVLRHAATWRACAVALLRLRPGSHAPSRYYVYDLARMRRRATAFHYTSLALLRLTIPPSPIALLRLTKPPSRYYVSLYLPAL